MSDNQPRMACSKPLRSLDEFSFLELQEAAPDDTGKGRYRQHPDGDHRLKEAWFVNSHKYQGKQNSGKCHKGINGTHQYLIHPAPNITGQRANNKPS
ncbi:hypothetical protein D3C81_813730 [compost metagenome]